MSRIIFEKNCIPISDYRKKLQNKIDDVLNKIHVNDKDVTWIICTEDFFDEQNITKNLISKFIRVRLDNKYGLCDPDEKKIWISTAAIDHLASNQATLKSIGWIADNQPDLLADVIMDELAHIVTDEDHGTEKYDNTLNAYKKQYYSEDISVKLISKKI